MASSDRPPSANDWEEARRRIWGLTEQATGGSTSEAFSCLYFAAGAAGAMRSDYQAKFTAGGACLGSSLLRAWGLIVNPRDGTYRVTADKAVDGDDASFCGHCWVEVGPSFDVTVVDVVTGYVGPRVVPSDLVVYHPVRTLSVSIRRAHRRVLDLVGNGAAKDGFLKEFFSSLVV